jgi:hypothetical protein
VTARKPTPPWRSREALLERAERILLESLVDNSASERRLYRVWVDSLRRAKG